MERANIVLANRMYSLRRDSSDFYSVRSFITAWPDNNERSKSYGIEFSTFYDDNRWGMAQSY